MSVRIVDKNLLSEVRTMSCVVCGHPPPSDAAHIKSRGAGGDDTALNVLPLCRSCHRIQHFLGFKRMVERYPILSRYVTFDENGKARGRT